MATTPELEAALKRAQERRAKGPAPLDKVDLRVRPDRLPTSAGMEQAEQEELSQAQAQKGGVSGGGYLHGPDGSILELSHEEKQALLLKLAELRAENK